jgi:2-keto-4-pentenoate hydratase/2-oxohepta-3-ene-1,7-dioic acid hydratase in catechol pathway
MEIVTFVEQKGGAVGRGPKVGALLKGEYILDFARAVADSQVEMPRGETASSPANPLAWFDLDDVWLKQARRAYDEVSAKSEGLEDARGKGLLVERSQARLLAPVPRPGKLICIGLNYRDHAAESNLKIPERPVVFSKFTTSVVAPGEPVILPATSQQVDYEAELAVVIGRRTKSVSSRRALEYVLGYTVFNDVSARDFQFADGQWQRGKSCDTFAPMGPAIVTTDDVSDPHKLSIELRLNGKTMQNSNTDQLIFGVPELISFLSATITLEPGDVIATGTPAGVGFARQPPVFLKDGDVMEVEIEKLGKLTSPVIAAGESISKLAHS